MTRKKPQKPVPCTKPKYPSKPVLTNASLLLRAADMIATLAGADAAEMAERLRMIAGTAEIVPLSRGDVTRLAKMGVTCDLGELERFRPAFEQLVRDLEKTRDENLPVILSEWV